MSFKVRRVQLDFSAPLNKVWEGFKLPERLDGRDCPECDGGGYSPRARHLHDQWYGKVPFDPSSTGSPLLQHDTPAVRAFAEHNVESAPWYYGTGEQAIVHEAKRLIGYWNYQWCHHLDQNDVDALVEEGRLMSFTHTWVQGVGWQKIDPPVHPTAREVNTWSLTGLSHDAINCMVVIDAKCKREGIDSRCSHCEGHGGVEVYPGQRAEREAWFEEDREPPTGEGWQLWETVSEGAPISRVYATAEELAVYMSTPGSAWGVADHNGAAAKDYDTALAFITGVGESFSMMSMAGADGSVELVDGVEAAVRMQSKDTHG